MTASARTDIVTAALELTNGLNAGQMFPLEGQQAILGRHPDCHIVLDVGAVSRQHAQILRTADDFFVEDLQSRNGTYVNNQLVNGKQLLRNRDQIRICDLQFTFHLSGSAPAPDLDSANTAMLFDDLGEHPTSTIMSKIDVSIGDSGLRLTVRPEVKLKALVEITNNLRKSLDLDDVLLKILESLFKIFVQADRGFVVLKEGTRLVPRAVKLRHARSDDTIRISRTIVNQVMTSKEAILSADAASDQRFDMAQSIADFRIRSMMCAPLLDSEGNSLGVIQIDAQDRNGRFQQDDLDVLVAVGGQAAFAVENAQLHAASLRQQALERDLRLAHEVQRGLLPAGPPEVAGYEFFDFYEPANDVGGDYYGYIPLPDGRLAIVLADVAGKGISAALLMAKLSAEVRFCLVSQSTPSQAIQQLNQSVANPSWEGRFVTLVLVVLNPTDHSVTVVNAGHPPPYLRTPDGKLLMVGEEEAALPLGVDFDTEFPAATVTLAPGDSLTVFTDGFSDAMAVSEEQYGVARLETVLRSNIQGTLQLGPAILEDVKLFVGNHKQFDDMCLICMGRK